MKDHRLKMETDSDLKRIQDQLYSEAKNGKRNLKDQKNTRNWKAIES
ncbi:hypothetical protein O0550_13425 [Brevibacillus halotolerans]|nr:MULTISPECIES: hypothetical protein [Brevibacillus]MCR8964196.1 hypothetical protein [Brevibacillus laterosporus]MCZ0836351.1 hypothetical protein [Brevibacillus halotolerans]